MALLYHRSNARCAISYTVVSEQISSPKLERLKFNPKLMEVQTSTRFGQALQIDLQLLALLITVAALLARFSRLTEVESARCHSIERSLRNLSSITRAADRVDSGQPLFY